jgi:hypothetical protein
LAKSPADYWVFVLQGFASRSTDFVIIPRQQLLESLSAIHGLDAELTRQSGPAALPSRREDMIPPVSNPEVLP